MSKECVFKRGEKDCAALVSKRCPACPFFKTAEDLEEGRRRSDARIDKLPRQQRNHINEMYRHSRIGEDV